MRPIVARTFAAQPMLPHLPIPDLRKTLANYRRSLEPFLSNDASRQRVDGALNEFVASGVADELHARLREHAASENARGRSWLETWWLEKAYLEWREPLLVNSNWWLLLRTAHLAPSEKHTPRQRASPMALGPYTKSQILRASVLSTNLLSYRALLEAERIQPDVLVIKPRPGAADADAAGADSAPKQLHLCMDQLKSVFGVTRRPVAGRDELLREFPSKSHHIAVLARNRVFIVDTSKYTKPAAKHVPLESAHGVDRIGLMRHLTECFAEIAGAVRGAALSECPPVCALTATHRDFWAAAYRDLCSYSEENTSNFREIESALFAVSLDDTNPVETGDVLLDGTTNDLDHAAALPFIKRMAHGNGGTALNRWFDKALNLVVMPNGHAGFNGEHSPQDALTPCAVFEHIVQHESSLIDISTVLSVPSLAPGSTGTMAATGYVRGLTWRLPPQFEATLSAACNANAKVIKNSDVQVYIFRRFGASFIKADAKMSPDAFFQLAMQLAHFRLTGKFVSTYETASSRRYFHGRTEACRVLTSEAREYVVQADKYFKSPASSDARRAAAQLLAQAASAHVKNLAAASSGNGVDRHLLGLRLCLGQKDGKPAPTPRIFSDPSYAQSTEWRLSTSSLNATATNFIIATGFGCVNELGYGVNYFFGADVIHYGVESKVSCGDTCSSRFAEEIARALADQARLVCGGDIPMEASKL